MRFAFAGTPEFAQHALQALIEAGYTPTLVLTQPDRPAGRGMREQASAVKQLAQQHSIAVLQPHGLRLDGKFAQEAQSTQAAMQALNLDVLVVAAYGLILPQWVLTLPRFGCLNIHASLLPRWRGAAPIHRAIEAGDAETGISIMQMDEGLDTGAVISIAHLAIEANETTAQLHDRLAILGGQCIVQAMEQLAQARNLLPSTPQAAEGITYAEKISRAESNLNWQLPAPQLVKKIQAFNPFPAAQSTLLKRDTTADKAQGETLKVWTARVEQSPTDNADEPGTVVAIDRSQGILVACGENTALRLIELQRAGSKRLPVQQFLNGFDLQVGDRFELITP
ncbi:methionyl-tRNA formyltransferase [Lampropedia puyangensis]|uniref:Methionyl-tRNA formyltransferase n=1 Tax=Lampropedia puyangensis TaxID=1330072 RepID=A0A4S8F8B7_9BURK|nr:methionyl-tRNA formyltransferase [Lampropedia puyangensis]THU02885.1 methionyl-tRNA formyltransferase [Lampropedia puyangensis]